MIRWLVFVGQRAQHYISIRQRQDRVHFPAFRVEDVIQGLDENRIFLHLGVVGEVRLCPSGSDIGAAERGLYFWGPRVPFFYLGVVRVLI